MPLSLSDEHTALAETAAKLAERHAATADTRAAFSRLAAGERPACWDVLVRAGLHAVALPEQAGGAGAGLAELAVVVEQFGRLLVPGPYLPTVLASALAAAADEHPPGLLTAFTDGATGAAVLDGDLRAEPVGDGWVVSGRSAPTLGLPGAQIVLVNASTRAGVPLWFRLDTVAGTQRIEAAEGVDLTRAVGHLELDGHHVAHGDVLTGIDDAGADLIVTALLAAEASGVMTWCLDTAVDHVRVRTQFGRPVGSFQAVQHKAATMFVTAQTAGAAAWDAARAADQPREQQRLAAAQAAVTAIGAVVETALECITLLGGVGFTWEHDAHLYWRRALGIAAVAGPESRWAARLGEVAMRAERDFSFPHDEQDSALRARVAAVLDEVLALPEDPRPTGWAPARGGPRRQRLADAGLVAPHLRPPFGLGAGAAEQAVIAEEFARTGVTAPTTVIGEWAMPTILRHGSQEQIDRFIAPTLRGEIVWCQLFSEPGAGSDLAGLSTRARRVDGGWTLTGQKVWNSLAHEADWAICLARTDPDAAKHEGLSYFLVDMRAPGVDVRPLRQATGRSEFNEVFLTDVFVPDADVVGHPGQGWELAMTTLVSERFSMGSTGLGHGSANLVRRAVTRNDHAATRDEALQVLGRATAREIVLSALNLRSALRQTAGSTPGAEAGVSKVYAALAQRAGSQALLDLLGPVAAVADTDPPYALDHLGLPAVLFGGGTVEIQLNVLARRTLGLPR